MIEHWIHANYLIGRLLILFEVGGCIQQGNILNSAEMYNSGTQEWATLPSTHKYRKMCSGVFMDGSIPMKSSNMW